MAVPSAVRQRMQSEEQALREQGIDPNGPPSGAPVASPQPATPPAPTYAPTPPSAPADDAAALRSKIAELENELRTQSGRASSSSTEAKELKDRLELISSNRQFLESSVTEQSTRIQELETQLQEMQAKDTSAQVQSVVSSLEGDGPTKEQLDEYGNSVDFIQRVVKQQLAAVIKPLLADLAEIKKQIGVVKDVAAKVPRLEKSAEVADMTAARAREEHFLNTEVIPHFPDFATVRTTPAWVQYLQKDTGRGYQIGHSLKGARQANDAVAIRAIIGAFYEQNKAKPSLDSLAVPGKSTADTPVAPAPAKMKASEYKTNLRSFTSKRMSKADWDAYRVRWEQALEAGNIEMDTELR